MARLANAHQNHISRWVLPSARRLLIEDACKNVPTQKLGEIADIEMGQSPPGDSCNNNGDGVPLIGGPADLGLIFPQITRWTNEPTKLCRGGDIIVCVRATIGEPRWSDGVYCLGRGVAGVRSIDQNISSKFLFHVIEAGEQFLLTQGTGTTFKTISKQHLASIQVPILSKEVQDLIGAFLTWLESTSNIRPNFADAPPFPEALARQKRSIIKIEELAAKIEEAQEVRGGIIEDTDNMWDNTLETVFKNLANAYPQKKFIDVCDVVRGGSPRPAGDPTYYDGPIPFLKVADLTNDKHKFVTRHSASIKEAGLSRSRYVKAGTLMLTNSGATLGVPKICTFDTCFNDGIQAFLNISEDIFIEFLYYFLCSKTHWFRNWVARGQGQPNLNTEMVKSMHLPIPPYRKQQHIVSYLDNLQSKIDTLKRKQSEASAELDALLPSILDKAFKGEL